MKAIIAGGGIGGLCTAIGLAQADFEVVLFERAKKLRQLGAGIGLAPNALGCLDRLGVGQEVRERGNTAARAVHRTWRGDLLTAGDWRGVWVHRADFQAALLDALGDPAIVRLDSAFVDFDQADEAVTARFSDGHEEQADLLVGADGIRSKVRAALHGVEKPRFTGSIAWRGVASFQHPLLVDNCEFWGRGSRFGLFSIGGGRTYWYGTRRCEEGFHVTEGERKAQLLSWFENWHEPVEEAIAATDETNIIQTDIYDHKPLGQWIEGRVALLGDAAHAMTADVGQGCAQVIEDAIALVDSLRLHQEVPLALKEYEHRRLKRANAILRLSHRYCRIGRLSNPVACALRDSLFLKHMPRRVTRRRRAWLWDGYYA